jgi:large subunit ribosomal protein L3
MKCLLGKKLYMTQIFSKDGIAVPVTVVQAGPCYITHIKSNDKNKYSAVQIGFSEIRANRITKPQAGHLKAVGKNLRFLREFRIPTDLEKEYKIGEAISVETFTEGEKVCVTTKSKGKGFQGVVRRHGFSGSPATHGHKDQLRMPGSIGATDPQRVFKGKRMGGQMGNRQVTVKNLTIAKIEIEKGLLYLMGAVPGARGALLKIKTTH